MEKTIIPTAFSVIKLPQHKRTQLGRFVMHYQPMVHDDTFYKRLSKAIEEEKAKAVKEYIKSQKG